MDKEFLKLVIYPGIFIIFVFLINVKIGWNKINENNLNSNNIKFIIAAFVLFFMLMIQGDIFWFIVYTNINPNSWLITIDQNIVYNFLYLIYLSIILEAIVLYNFINYSTKNIWKAIKYLKFGILWIALADIPSVIWLSYILNEIWKIT